MRLKTKLVFRKKSSILGSENIVEMTVPLRLSNPAYLPKSVND